MALHLQAFIMPLHAHCMLGQSGIRQTTTAKMLGSQWAQTKTLWSAAYCTSNSDLQLASQMLHKIAFNFSERHLIHPLQHHISHHLLQAQGYQACQL